MVSTRVLRVANMLSFIRKRAALQAGRLFCVQTMDCFDSISLPFRLWQITCLSPYVLKSQQPKSHPTRVRRNCSIFAIVGEAMTIVLCIIFLDKIVNPALKQAVKVLDSLTMFLMQLTALVILWESYRKRRLQQNFFNKISSIDFLMEFKMGIRLNHADKKKSIAKRMIGWLLLNVAVFTTDFVILSMAFDIAYRWWAIFFASYFICSLRYHQIATCVDVIHYRYQLLNQFINNHLRLNDCDDGEGGVHVHSTPTVVLDAVETRLDTDPVTLISSHRNGNQLDSVYERLHHLRRVCRLLSSANHNMNEAFQYSIPLIIVNDFLQILINWYWILRILLQSNIRIYFLIPPLFWTLMNFTHVISLSASCHHATEQVIV